MTQMSEQGSTTTAIIHPVLWPTLNPNDLQYSPRGVTPTKVKEAGGGQAKGPSTLTTGQRYIMAREKKLPRERPVIPKSRWKGQIRRRAHKEKSLTQRGQTPPVGIQTLQTHLTGEQVGTYAQNRRQELVAYDQEMMIDVDASLGKEDRCVVRTRKGREQCF